MEYGRAVHVAMDQTHGLTIFQVDGGIQDHGKALATPPAGMQPDGSVANKA
jgi:hypothetical protein